MKKTIAVVYNAVDRNSQPDELDVLDQVAAVSKALADLDFNPVPVSCGLDLERFKRELTKLGPGVVFNLVESLAGQGRLIHVVPYLLDSLGIPYTGCPADTIYLTSHKTAAKERMRQAGLPTPDWIGPCQAGMVLPSRVSAHLKNGVTNGPWIIKSLWEHGSLGLEKENIITALPDRIGPLLEKATQGLGRACFAEAFINGREFNISLLGDGKEVRVLPPAEIRFLNFGQDEPKIVGYRAKWCPNAYEYQHTQRSFDFSETDRKLLSRLCDLALSCWDLFSLAGFARVDFRVDENQNPYILEVNANPCISPDAGFSAALDRAGISYTTAIARIMDAVIRAGE
ncbi:ATP-grasp domain-containing protein [uncultured Desulfobacter sp.]|uniref:D-alanine--D-alanine ligase family protein n=1 Tax=uncultured Desulfobacter sp. TaxID=240139 RepID=UPI002AAA83B3|nr:ATP-grasp domain-containing protein [uncultured Desulfobacter sp.]